jgi:hypothetical protein
LQYRDEISDNAARLKPGVSPERSVMKSIVIGVTTAARQRDGQSAHV